MPFLFRHHSGHLGLKAGRERKNLSFALPSMSECDRIVRASIPIALTYIFFVGDGDGFSGETDAAGAVAAVVP